MTNDPVLIAYAVQRGRDRKKVRYTRIGRAYPHDTGQGLTLILEALPLKFDGKIVLLELDEALATVMTLAEAALIANSSNAPFPHLL